MITIIEVVEVPREGGYVVIGNRTYGPGKHPDVDIRALDPDDLTKLVREGKIRFVGVERP